MSAWSVVTPNIPATSKMYFSMSLSIRAPWSDNIKMVEMVDGWVARTTISLFVVSLQVVGCLLLQAE